MSTKQPLRCEVSLAPSFDLVDKVAWAMDTPVGGKVSDYNIQNNFDECREMIADSVYSPLPAHTNHDLEQGFEVLPTTATPEEVSAQKEAIAAVEAEGKTPFHYEVCYIRYVCKAEGDNPNRKRSSRGRGRASAKSNIAG